MSKLFYITKSYVKRNAPTILTSLGAAGVIATSVTTAYVTPKAMRLLEEARNEKKEELTTIETVKVAGKAYAPAVIMGASTIACLFGANTLNKRKQAALTSAYMLVDSTYKQYKDKVIELYGTDAHSEVKDGIVKDKLKDYDQNRLKDENTELFYDDFSGRYFESTIEKVQQAEYRINRDLTMRDYAYLNEFYEYLGIPEIDSGWTLGWSVGACLDMYWQNWIDFNHRKVTMDDGLECRIITIFQEPIAGFEDYS